MSKSVAVIGEVVKTPGSGSSSYVSPAITGSWSAGEITYQSYDKLKINGDDVIFEAECTFSFKGNGPPPDNSPVSDSETVTLTASTTKLQKGSTNVLVHGDKATGTYLNELKVDSTNKLKTE